MFSFLSSTFVVSKIGTPKPTLLSRPTTWRFFSQSHARCAEPEDPEARRKRLDRKNEQRRQKYHSDPVFREKEITRQTLRFNNPLYRDEEKRKMRLRRQDWCNHNPKGYAVSIERSTLYITQRRASDPRFKFSSQLHHFLMRTTLAREELPWKTHVPTVYPEKVTKECARCDRRPPGGGAKLWWESRKNNTEGVAEEYLCHACYIPKEDWQNALPQGYEDVKNMRELRARKKKLDGSNQGSQSVIPTKSR